MLWRWICVRRRWIYTVASCTGVFDGLFARHRRGRRAEAEAEAAALGFGFGGGGKVGAATDPTNLLVCFPVRQHLALMPKYMCSPSRATLDRAVAARRRQLQLPATRWWRWWWTGRAWAWQ